MNLFAETLLRFVLGIVWRVVLFPLLWLAAAPIILVRFFGAPARVFEYR
jgi:hypothetical protein